MQVQAQAVQTLQACTGAKRMAERALTGGGGRENNLFLTRRTDSPGARHSEQKQRVFQREQIVFVLECRVLHLTFLQHGRGVFTSKCDVAGRLPPHGRQSSRSTLRVLPAKTQSSRSKNKESSNENKEFSCWNVEFAPYISTARSKSFHHGTSGFRFGASKAQPCLVALVVLPAVGRALGSQGDRRSR